MRVYISGPITGTEDYLERFEKTKASIMAAGAEVINPAALNYVMPKDATHEEYMKMCIPLLDMADVIYMMSGWQQSKGCGIEFEHAYENGISICFEKETVPKVMMI